MAPEGPYHNPWSSGDWYLVAHLVHGERVYSIVQNGTQAYQGLLFPTLKDARAYFRENGYSRKGV